MNVDTQEINKIIEGEITPKNISESFEESETYFKKIIDSAQDAILQVDTEGNIKYANTALYKMCDYKDILDKSIYDYIHPMDLNKFSDYTNCVIRNCSDYDIDFRLRSRNGKYMWVETRGSTFYRNKLLLGIVFIIRNGTYKKINEKKLDSSEERFRSIFMESPIGIALYDGVGELLEINISGKKIAQGFSSGDINEKNILKSRYIDKNMRIKLQLGESVKFTIPKIQYNHSLNGEIKGCHYEFLVNPLRNPEGYLVQFQEIKDIKFTESQLENIFAYEKEDKIESGRYKYKNLIELLPDAIMIRDESSLFFANSTAVKLLGAKDKHELMDRWDKVLQFAKDSFENIFNTSLVNSNIEWIFSEEKIMTVDNKILDAKMGILPVIIGSKKMAIIIIKDISEEKREQIVTEVLTEKLETEKLRTEFFANISHELRTPINVIYSALQVMDIYVKKVEENHEKLEQYENVIKQNCHRLIRLVNNLIDVTKIDTGYFEVHNTYCNIVYVIENIADSVVPYVKSRGMEICFDTDVEEKYTACDLDIMERVILNLIANSVKFGREGGKILVSIKDQIEEVVISVKDDGIGIPLQKQKSIFERFARVDKSFKRNVEGSGIGLSLVKDLIELQGGNISLISNEGKGSEFVIKIPISSEAEQFCMLDDNRDTDIIKKMDVEFSDIYFW